MCIAELVTHGIWHSGGAICEWQLGVGSCPASLDPEYPTCENSGLLRRSIELLGPFSVRGPQSECVVSGAATVAVAPTIDTSARNLLAHWFESHICGRAWTSKRLPSNVCSKAAIAERRPSMLSVPGLAELIRLRRSSDDYSCRSFVPHAVRYRSSGGSPFCDWRLAGETTLDCCRRTTR
jgi:hypothetical protein